jgi:hypothetical protein
MDTTRIDICYRPLRIAWAVESGDHDGFRDAVRLSHAFFGGRFNPIVLVESPEAQNLVELFRADIVLPVGASEKARQFVANFPHLRSPLFPEKLFISGFQDQVHCSIVDMHNAMAHWQQVGDFTNIKEANIGLYEWDASDPPANLFLIQLGAFPEKENIGIDYVGILEEFLGQRPLAPISIPANSSIPPETVSQPSLSYLARHGLHRHYSVSSGWDNPGFYFGDAGNIDDLMRYWNIRAADVNVQFIDPNYLDRFDEVRTAHADRLKKRLSHFEGHHRKLAVWTTRDRLNEVQKVFPDEDIVLCPIDGYSWKGGAIVPPVMIMGEASSLGVLGESRGKRSVSFAINEKPFSSDRWFSTQHLVASISVTETARNNSLDTWRVPFIPELNRFVSEKMYFDTRRVRLEPERIGVIIDAADTDLSLVALPTVDVAEQIFGLVGVRASLSDAGLIARQLISRFGGIDGARALKIPGVRRLIKTYGPNANFSMKSALQLIGSRVSGRLESSFQQHKDLYIEARPLNTPLTPHAVFGHLVERGLFRIGVELDCPACRLSSWVALDHLKQRNSCDLCGAEFDATRQLVGGEFRYRRSGVLGLEKHSQGAVPVALLLQQLSVNIGMFADAIYLTSMNLEPKAGIAVPKCETDFLAIFSGRGGRPTQLLLGECKDEGGRIDGTDVLNMQKIADTLDMKRFKVFILFAKLSSFSEDELQLAKALNTQYEQRVILLTQRELEPYHLYERTNLELKISAKAGSLENLAQSTHEIYFKT